MRRRSTGPSTRGAPFARTEIESMPTIRIGVSSVGSGIGKSVVDACRLSSLPLTLIGMGNDPAAFAAFDCDIRDVLPTIYDPHYVDALLDACLRHRVELLIPGLDDELIPLARQLKRFTERGIRVVVANEPILALCRDKLRMSKALRPISPAFVESHDASSLAHALESGTAKFPLVAKPRAGFASRGVRLLREPGDLAGLDDTDVIQPIALPCQGDPHRDAFLEGLRKGRLPQLGELSVQVVIGTDGREIGRMASCNELVNGIPTRVVPVECAEIRHEIDRILPHFIGLGLRGPLNLQGRLTDDGPKFFEMNARFTGITGLRAMMGFNEVEAVIMDALDVSPRPARIEINPRRIGIRQVTARVVDVDTDDRLEAMAQRSGQHAGCAAARRVLVTGANSYLGRACISALLEHQGVAEVVALVRDPVRFSDGREAPLPDGAKIRDMRELLEGGLNPGTVDVICHLAGGRPTNSAAQIAESLAFTRAVASLAARHNVPGLINASSQSVYGLQQRPPWRESTPVAPESAYAQSKWASELLCQTAHEMNRTTAVTSLRMARLVGVSCKMRWDEAVHSICRQAARGKDLLIRDGTQQLDLLDVRDAAALVARLATSAFEAWPRELNAGSGQPLALIDLARLISRECRHMLGFEPGIEVDPQPVDLRMGMDTRLADATLGWRPSIPLSRTIRELIAAANR